MAFNGSRMKHLMPSKVGVRYNEKGVFHTDILGYGEFPDLSNCEISRWEMGTLNYEALAGFKSCVTVEVNATDEAIEFLMTKGFDAKLGARPLQRVIDDEIKKPLSKMMLLGELTAGGMVEVSLADEKLVVNFKVGKQQEVLTQLKPKVSDEKKSQ